MPDRFRKVVDRIMRSPTLQEPAVESPPPDRPESFGWLRRPEHDSLEGEAWELPDGAIRLLARSRPGSVARQRRARGAGVPED